MMKNLAVAFAATITGAALLAVPAARAQTSTEPLKVGFVYVSPIGDAGWTTQHDRGRRQMEAALGPSVKVTAVENVAEGGDSERVIRDLVQQGNRLIFTTSFGYMEPTIKVARQFPSVAFEHATGYKTAANVGTYNARFYEGRYLAGIVAGRMSRKHVAGYVAAFPIPEVLQGINAFTRGMRSVDPTAEVKVVWVNAWYDPGRERDAAITLVNQGADVLTHHTDSTAVAAAAQEKGVFAVAYHSDMARFAPTAQLCAVTHHWGEYYLRETRKVLDGTWKPGQVWGGLRDGFVKLEALHASVPADVRKLVAQRADEIAGGKFHPFAGQVVDNEGKIRQADGVMADDVLNAMDYYVQGVQGRLPRQ
jgi:simple sugar transport system substrate-binding protein